MVASSADEAMANAYAYSTCRLGRCLQYVRTWLEIPAHWPSASRAWTEADHRHTNRNPPKGAPVFWTGGSHGYGHIALSTGGGYVRSTDAPVAGWVRTMPLSWFDTHWPSLHFVGWAEDLNEQRISWLSTTPAPSPPPSPSPPPPPTEPLPQELPEMFMYRSPNGARAYMVADGKQVFMEPDVANAALTPLSGSATKPLYFQATANFVTLLNKAYGPPIES